MKTEECKDHRLYRATPPDRDTGKGFKYRFLLSLFPTTCSTSVSVFYNHFLLCVSKLCFFWHVCLAELFFRVTDNLLSFDLHLLFILILLKLCLNLLCLHRSFIKF